MSVFLLRVAGKKTHFPETGFDGSTWNKKEKARGK